ncbi:MAG: hypothetical protein AcusKO_02780 [Acuticoccus sp.]
MTNTQILDATHDIGGYKVDPSRGAHIDRVSSEWFSRPDDERFLSLSDLYAAVKNRADLSRTLTVESAAIRVEARRDDPARLALALPGANEAVTPRRIGPSGSSRALWARRRPICGQLPAPLAGINLQHGLAAHRAEQVKTLETDDGRHELRAVTGPDYGRIFDHELVEAVATHRRRRHRRHALESPRRPRLGDPQAQPACGRHQGDNDALRLGSGRVPVSWWTISTP